MKFNLIATCPEETKSATIRELESLKANDIREGYRAVHFSGDERLYYRAHLQLHTASRLFRVIKEFPAHNEQMLFDQARRIRWKEIFSPKQTFRVDGVPGDRGQEFMGSNAISKRVRQGLEASFTRAGEGIPKVDLKEPTVVVVAFVRRGRCTLSLDTSGVALHKRGYRNSGHPAPLKETLAAAILDMAGYDGSQPLWDPFCGSGTLPIEASYLSMNKAPLIHRKKGQFGFEYLADFNRNLWREVQDEIRRARMDMPSARIFASDIDTNYVALTRKNALKARVEKHINTANGSFFDLAAKPKTFFTGNEETTWEPGLIVSNLPYGERISTHKPQSADADELKELYAKIGDTLKQHCTGWRAALLAAVDAPYKFIGLKPSKRLPILNGSISCKLLLFDLYKGRKATDRS